MPEISVQAMTSAASTSPVANNAAEPVLSGDPATGDGANFTAVLAGQLARTNAGKIGGDAAALAVGSDQPAQDDATTDGSADAGDLLTLITAQMSVPGSVIAVPVPAGTISVAPADGAGKRAAAPEMLLDAAHGGATKARSASAEPASSLLATAPRGAEGYAPSLPLADQASQSAAIDPFPRAPRQDIVAAVLAAPRAGTAEAAAAAPLFGSDAGPGIVETPAVNHAAGAYRIDSTGPSESLRVDTSVAAPRWGDELAQKVVWLANRNDSRAELVLTPPQMGKIEVTLTVNQNGETSAQFVSPSPQVREALEQSMARLREAFAAAGITLGQTSVGADSAPRDERGRERPGGHRGAGRITAGALPAGAPSPFAQGRGMVDTFA